MYTTRIREVFFVTLSPSMVIDVIRNVVLLVGIYNFLNGKLVFTGVEGSRQANIALSHIPQNQTVALGDSASFQCIPMKHVTFIIWYFEKRLPQSRELKTPVVELAICRHGIECRSSNSIESVTVNAKSELNLTRISLDHMGKYECAVVDGVHTIRHPAFLAVLSEPDTPIIRLMSFGIQSGQFHENDILSLACSCDEGFPRPQLSWFLSSAEVFSKDAILLDRNQLQVIHHEDDVPDSQHLIKSVLRLRLTWKENGASVWCKAKNTAGSNHSKPFSLNVEYRPRIYAFRYNPWIIASGYPVNIPCEVRANPPVSIRWTDWRELMLADSPTISSELVLRNFLYSNLHRSNQWQVNLTCFAENTRGMNKRTLQIIVQSVPIVHTPKYVQAKLGQPLRLHCDTSANPPADRIYWFRKNFSSIVSNGYIETDRNKNGSTHYWFSPVVQMSAVGLNDAGLHVCVAENRVRPSGYQTYEIGRGHGEIQVIVQYPPGKPSVSTDHIGNTFQIGSTVRLLCTLDMNYPGLPAVRYRWMWRQRLCDGLNKLQEKFIHGAKERELLLKPIEAQDEGDYYCQVSNKLGEELSDPFEVNITVPGKLVQSSSPVKKLPIDEVVGAFLPVSVAFTCIAEGRPAPEIHWTHNEIRLDTDVAESKWSTTLVKRCIAARYPGYLWKTESTLSWNGKVQMALSDEGYYQCKFGQNNETLTDQGKTHLQLLYAPQPLIEGTTFLVPDTIGDAVFEHSAQPSSIPHVADLLNDQVGNPTTSTLTRDKIHLYCLVRSNPTPHRLIWKLIHKTDPCLTADGCSCTHGQTLAELVSDMNIAGAEGEARILHGDVAARYIRERIKRTMSYTESLVIAYLKISSNMVSNSSVLVAQLENSLGCDTCRVEMRKLHKPDQPDLVKVEQASWNAALVSWKTGFDGGWEQRTIAEVTMIAENRNRTGLPASVVNKNYRKRYTTDASRWSMNYSCWLRGLLPDSTYQVVLHSENKLGRSERTAPVQFVTPSIKFPTIVNFTLLPDGIRVNFTDLSDTNPFCLQVEWSTGRAIYWSNFYNDCPTPSQILQPELIRLDDCEIQDPLEYGNRRQKLSRRSTEEGVRVEQAHNSRFLAVPEGFFKQALINNLTSVDKTFISYRLRMCLRNKQTKLCSLPYEVHSGELKLKKRGLVWQSASIAAAILTLLFLLILSIYSRKKNRSVLKVWKERRKQSATRGKCSNELNSPNSETTVTSIAGQAAQSSQVIQRINRTTTSVTAVQSNPLAALPTPVTLCPVYLQNSTLITTAQQQQQQPGLNPVGFDRGLSCATSSTVFLIPTSKLIPIANSSSVSTGSGKSTPVLLHIPVRTSEDAWIHSSRFQ